MKWKYLGAVALAASASVTTLAQPVQEDFDTVDLLTAMVAASTGRHALPIDRRIRLPRCPEQVAVNTVDSDSLAVRCNPLGWRLRVPMVARANQPVMAAVPASAQTPVIRRGDNVQLEISTETFTVSYTAIALDDAAVGQSVRLRTSDAKSPVRAVVTAHGRAALRD